MASDKQQNGLDRPPAQIGNAAIDLEPLDELEGGGSCTRTPRVLALRHRRLLIASSLFATVAIFCLTYFVMHPKYEATAIIRPVGRTLPVLADCSRAPGYRIWQTLRRATAAHRHDPESLRILESYTFTTSMVKAEKLAPKLTKGSHHLWPFSHGQSSLYDLYLLMSSRFDYNYSMRTGNLSVSYIDKNPELATTILGLYIDRLRSQLREHDVRDSSAAIETLQGEAAKAIDPMLRDDLNDMISKQLKRKKIAQVNADFAFTVLDPPYTSPYPYAPWVIIYSLVAALLVPLLVFAGLAARELLPRLKRKVAAVETVRPRRLPDVVLTEEHRPHTL